MSLRKQQSEFAYAVALLILHANKLGYEVTLGDAWALDFNPIIDELKGNFVGKRIANIIKTLKQRRHSRRSWHYKRLALDLNAFDKDGNYLTETEDHRPLGEYWESIGGTWGGRFKNPDGNHYSWKESR